MEHELNRISLCGRPTPAEYSHENHGRRFYRLFLEVPRLSGAVDRLRVLLPESLLAQAEAATGGLLFVQGQLRSYNHRTETGRRLVISAFAEQLAACGSEPENRVLLTGALCRQPVYRRTPLGREICDGMLAVNRPYRRADYLPCIFWGRTAQEVSRLPVGTMLALDGRLQSRDYVKQLETGPETRTAYEVSVMEAEIADI